MNTQRVVIIDGGYDTYAYEASYLKEHGYVLEMYDGDPQDRDAKIEFASGSVGMMVRGTLIDEHFLSQVPELKAVVRYGVGYDNVDLSAATRQGVRVANVQGYANHSVSDHAIALMYSCIRMLPAGSKSIYNDFSKPPTPEIFELHDKTVGIIGLGRIGGTFCTKVRHLFGRVLAYDPNIPESVFDDCGATQATLQHVLGESHVISLHCDLNETSYHIINDNAFAIMNNRPILINTARGDVIDPDALLKALNQGKIHCAGLDVFKNEPTGPEEQPLITHPRVLSTGHYAWYSDAAMRQLHERAVENLVNLINGKVVEDCLNP